MTLTIQDVTKKYSIKARKSIVNALNGVSVTVEKGKTLGIVGESGCGKSTLARLVTGLEDPTTGSIAWEGSPIENLAKNRLRTHRSKVQLVFQDPYSSLNPRQRIGDSIAEVLEVHHLRTKSEIPARINELFTLVGLATDLQTRYPHQLSGGQRQRVSVARALAAEPELLVPDEPVSALDVSVRAEVMNLLIDLRSQLGLTYIFISHDLAMIKYISDSIAVMYLGKIVESGTWDQVINAPQHPYTQALLQSVPSLDADKSVELKTVEGQTPSPADVTKGCEFAGRCPFVTDACREQVIPLTTFADNHQARCIRLDAKGNLPKLSKVGSDV